MTIIGLVAAGLGVSILPASFRRVQLQKCAGCRSKKDAVSEMWLVWSKHHEQGQRHSVSNSNSLLRRMHKFGQYTGAKCAVNHKAK
jgi:DNA-binding transcriptional LysR family regulator